MSAKVRGGLEKNVGNQFEFPFVNMIKRIVVFFFCGKTGFSKRKKKKNPNRVRTTDAYLSLNCLLMQLFQVPDAILFKFSLLFRNSTRLWWNDAPRDGRTDTPSYRDAKTHLKSVSWPVHLFICWSFLLFDSKDVHKQWLLGHLHFFVYFFFSFIEKLFFDTQYELKPYLLVADWPATVAVGGVLDAPPAASEDDSGSKDDAFPSEPLVSVTMLRPQVRADPSTVGKKPSHFETKSFIFTRAWEWVSVQENKWAQRGVGVNRAVQSEWVNGTNKWADGRANGPALTSRFLAVLIHRAILV